jgi:hypothetical protein
MSVDSVRYPGHDAGLERQEENSMKVNTYRREMLASIVSSVLLQ